MKIINDIASCWSISMLPKPFNVRKGEYKCSLDSKKESTMNSGVAWAVLDMFSASPKSACVKIMDSVYASEYHHSDGSCDVVTYNAENGELYAAHVLGSDHSTIKLNKSDTTATTVSALLLPILASFFYGERCEPTEYMEKLKDFLTGAEPDETVGKAAMFRLCDYVYYGIEKEVIPVNIPSSRNVKTLTATKIASGKCSGEVLWGSSTILNAKGGGKSKKGTTSKVMTVKALRDEFSEFISKQSWTEDEKKLIPSFPDDFPVPEEAAKMANLYVKSSDMKRPVRNFMWRGITAYGKSTGVEVLAAVLNMPLLKITCFSTMETQNFLSDFVPDTAETTVELPSLEEIELDPAGAYERMTGKNNPDISPDEVLVAYGKTYAAQAASGPRYKHVVSNYVQALVKGYIIEVQEASRIKDAGVLVGLNEYDRPGALIPLIDGSVSSRHHDAMVVFTDNVGYDSCRNLDPSVLRRFGLIIDSYDLPKTKVWNRISYNTGCKKELFEECFVLFTMVEKFCRDHDITEGAVSVNELELMIQSVMLGIPKQEALQVCVIGKATSDLEEQKDIQDAVSIM